MSHPAQASVTGRRLSFGRRRRLLRRRDFLRVYDARRRASGRHLVLFGLRRAEPEAAAEPWRLGITTTRRSGGAVVRNRLRRRLREFFRTRQRWIADGWDYVVNARPSLEAAPPRELAEEVRRALGRLGAWRGPEAGDEGERR